MIVGEQWNLIVGTLNIDLNLILQFVVLEIIGRLTLHTYN
jgi:hypothetical protein